MVDLLHLRFRLAAPLISLMSISLDQDCLAGVSDRAAALDLEDDEVELQVWEGGGRAGGRARASAFSQYSAKGRHRFLT